MFLIVKDLVAVVAIVAYVVVVARVVMEVFSLALMYSICFIVIISLNIN